VRLEEVVMKVVVALAVIGLFILGVTKGWTGVWMGVVSVGFVLARVYLHRAFAESFYGKE